MDTIEGAARAGLALAVAGYAAFTLTVLAARLFGLPFTMVVAAGSVIWAAVGVVAIGWGWRRRAQLARLRPVHLIGLLTLMGVSGGLATAINAPEEDDSLYVPAALHALAAPADPLSFDLEWMVPFNGSVKLRSELGMVSNGVEFFWAFLSRLTGADYLALYQIGGSFVFGAAFPLIYFWLLAKFSATPSAALFGTLAVVVAAFVLFREGGIGFGIILNKIWMGKAVLLALVIPIVAGFAFEVVARPTFTRWLVLLAAVVAATGCSSSSFFLVPALLLALTPGGAWRAYESDGPALRRWIAAAAIPAAAIYPVAIGAVFYVRYRHQVAHHESLTITSNMEIFNSGFVPFIGRPFSLTALVVLASVAMLLYRRRPGDSLLLLWFVVPIAIFVNPLTSGFVARHLTSITIYNRLFWIVPVFTLTGVAAARFAEWFPGRLRMTWLTVTLLALVAWRGVHADAGTLQMDVPKFQVLGAPRFAAPSLKLDPNLVADVRDLERLLPEGNTLAAADYCLAMAILTTRYRQYCLWPIDIVTMYGEIQGFPDEASLRYGAARFLIGQAQFQGDFERLLETPVRNVVVSKRLVHDVSGIMAAAGRHGFAMVGETGRYVIYTRGL